MKKIFLLIILVFSFVLAYSQSTVYIRADTVKIRKEGGNSNLVIENGTRSVTGGVLTNVGNGLTRFILPTGGGVDSVTKNTAGDSFYVWKGGIKAVLADRGMVEADNGLTDSSGRVILGGSLYKNTTIDAGSNYLFISGSLAQQPFATSNSVGNGAAFTGNLDGVQAQSQSDGSYGVIAWNSNSDVVDNISGGLKILRTVAGTPLAGLGGSIDYFISTNGIGGGSRLSNQLISKWTNENYLSQTSQFIITGVNIGTTGDILTLNGNKSIKANGYGSGTFTGTPAYTLQVDASGNIIEGAAGGGGTPDLQAVTDVGNTTTNAIVTQGGIDVNNAGANITARDAGFTKGIQMVTNTNTGRLNFFGTFGVATLDGELFTGSRALQLPDESDTLATRGFVRGLVTSGGGGGGTFNYHIVKKSGFDSLAYSPDPSNLYAKAIKFIGATTASDDTTLTVTITGGGASNTIFTAADPADSTEGNKTVTVKDATELKFVAHDYANNDSTYFTINQNQGTGESKGAKHLSGVVWGKDGSVYAGIYSFNTSGTRGATFNTDTTNGGTFEDQGSIKDGLKYIRPDRSQWTDSTMIDVKYLRDNTARLFNVKNYGAVGDGITNDATAIQAAQNACDAAGGGIVYFPNGTYLVSSALVTSVGGQNPNSQLYINASAAVSTRKSFIWLGESQPNNSPLGFITNPITTGVIIKSTITGSGTLPCVIGAVPVSSTFSYNNFSIKNITIVVPSNTGGGGPTMGGINMGLISTVQADNVLVTIDSSMNNSVSPVTNETFGIRTTLTGGESGSHLTNCVFAGLKYGVIGGEHLEMDQVQAWACYYGFLYTGTYHSSHAGRLGTYWCKYAVALGGDTAYFNIDELNVEANTSGGFWYQQTNTIYDPNNYGKGDINYLIVQQGVGRNPGLFTKNGGTGIQTRLIGTAGSGGGITVPGNYGNILMNRNAALAGTDSLNFLGGSLGVAGNVNIQKALPKLITTGTTGSNAIFELGQLVVNEYALRQTTAANQNTPFVISGRGTGFDAGGGSTIGGQFLLYGSDYVADQTNKAGLAMSAWNNKNTFVSIAGGTGTRGPILFEADASGNLNQLSIATNGSVGINNKFNVDINGNITKINNVTTSWPSSNSAGVLTNNGSGTLTWSSAGSGVTGSGTSGQVAYWNGTSSVTGSSSFTTSLSSADIISITGSNSGRSSIHVNTSNASGNASSYWENDRGGFASYAGFLHSGSSSNASGNIFGLTRSDRTFLIHDGANGTGLAIGTLNTTPLHFGTDNTARWVISTTGHFLAGTDNTYDIGASGATRPRNLYVGTDGTFGGNVSITGSMASQKVSTSGFQAGYTEKTSTYTATTADYTINCTSGTFTVNLPAVGSTVAGTMFVIKNSGAGTITVDGNASELIDGSTTYSLSAQYKYVIIQNTSTAWVVIGNN